MEEIIEAKRDLGEGRWDKILKRKMVELSFADTYEEAKDEWETTGKVYKHSHYGNQPDWVRDTGHTGYCLCGRNIAYHFQVENTVTGVKEVVGSDHIGAYLIIRQLISNLNIKKEDITEAMIKDWLDSRIQTMKSNAWWEENGEHFNEMFEAIQTLDGAINIKEKHLIRRGEGYFWDYTLKTRATGKFGDYGYQMASIVWRWNHADNPKNQLLKYGYPNARLWADLNLFYALRTTHQPKLEQDVKTVNDNTSNLRRQLKERKEKAEALRVKQEEARLKWEAGAEERRIQEKKRIANELEQREQRRLRQEKRAKEILENQSDVFVEMCDYYGIPQFSSSNEYTSYELRSLAVIKEIIITGKELSSSHLHTLKDILGGNNDE